MGWSPEHLLASADAKGKIRGKQIFETSFTSPSGSFHGEHWDQSISCLFQGQCSSGVPVLLLGGWGLSRCREGEHGHRVGPE